MDELLLKLVEGAPGWIIAIALLYLVLKSILPANATLNKANHDAIAQQQTISRNLEDTYDKKLAVSAELIEQRLITVGMQRDREREQENAKLRQEIVSLISKGELDHGKIGVLEKRASILDEANIVKDKRLEDGQSQIAMLLGQISGLEGQVAKVTAEFMEERDLNKALRERISSLELQIATLLAPAIAPPPASTAAA